MEEWLGHMRDLKNVAERKQQEWSVLRAKVILEYESQWYYVSTW